VAGHRERAELPRQPDREIRPDGLRGGGRKDHATAQTGWAKTPRYASNGVKLRLERGRPGAAEVDVEPVCGGPAGNRLVDLEGGDHPLAAARVANRVEDRVVFEERI